MITAANNKYRFVFAIVFALIANAALFSLLSFLVDFKIPIQNLQASTSNTIKTYALAAKKTPEPTATSPLTKTDKKASAEIDVDNKPKTEVSNKPKIKPSRVITTNVKTPAQKSELLEQKETPKKINIEQNVAKQIATAETQPEPSIKKSPYKITQHETTSANNANTDQDPMQEIADKLANTVFDAKNLKKIYSPSPNYPRRAKKRNIQGWILTEFKIKKDGSVDQIKVVGGKNTSFFKKEVLKTLAVWRFAPKYPHEIRASMRFVFHLRG